MILEILRAVNVALLSAAVLSLIIWLSDTWANLSWGRRLSMVSIRLLLIGGVVGSAIKYATHAPTDGSIVIVTVSSLGVIVGQWLARNDAHPIRPAQVLTIVDGVEHARDMTPCDHPGCIAARIELRRLADPDL